MDINMDGRFKVEGWPGVAVRIDGYVKTWDPYIAIDEDEDGNEIEIETGEGEWVDDVESGMVNVVMIGDDAKHVVDISDLTEIDDEDYCSDCGQLGCGWS